MRTTHCPRLIRGCDCGAEHCESRKPRGVVSAPGTTREPRRAPDAPQLPLLDRRGALVGLALLPVSGCAAVSADLTATASAIGKVSATVATDLTSASNVYAIAKGIGQVALTVLSATPEGAAISAAISVGDAVVASLTAAAPAASAAASAASTLLTSANAILLAGAPEVKAVANAA